MPDAELENSQARLLLRPYIAVEMAIERALVKQPKVQAPKDAFGYICLEGGGGKLMRGCACRGDSAGFVHLDCLTKLAVSKEESGNGETVFDAWNKCGNCKQLFQGALKLEMARLFWRRHRSSQDLRPRYHATRSLAHSLGINAEVDAASQLLDEASICVGNNKERLLDLKLLRVNILLKNGQPGTSPDHFHAGLLSAT